MSEGKRRRRTGQQSITGPIQREREKELSTLTLTPTINLKSPMNLTCMSLDLERKPEYPERTHAGTGGTKEQLV